MSVSPDFIPAHDVFGRSAPMAFVEEFPLLGIPLQVRSNAAAAAAHASTVFGAWRALDATLVAPGRRAMLDIVVHGPALAGEPPTDFAYRAHGDVFVASGPGLLVSVQASRAHAVAFVSPSWLDWPEWCASHVCGWAIMAAAQHDRVPIHAGVVVSGQTALVLVGPSGAGKSTLTCACHELGADVLTDDTVFVSLAPAPRLWAHTQTLWVPPDMAARLRTASRPPIVRPNGKRRVPVPLDDAGPRLSHAASTVVVMLERDVARPPRVETATADEVHRALSSHVEDGFDLYTTQRGAVVEWLQACPARRLVCGNDPRESAALLLESYG